MPIPMSCRCGRGFQARDDQAGQSAFCPQCGAKHFVPTPDSFVAEPTARQQSAPPSRAPQTVPAMQGTSQKMFPCVVCRCKFLPSQVYDSNGEIICKGCWASSSGPADSDDDDFDADAESGLEVRTKFFPLAWMVFFFPVELRVNGKTHPLSWWSTKFIPLRPGKYEVKMTTHSFFGASGVQSRRINVPDDGVKVIDYFYGSWWWASMNVWDK